MTFEEMNPGSVKTDGHAERKCLGLPDTEATPDHLRGQDQTCEGVFVYTEGWDHGFAQDGDPYGIQADYLPQSANPDAAVIPPQDAAFSETIPTPVTTEVTPANPTLAPDPAEPSNPDPAVVTEEPVITAAEPEQAAS